MRNIFYRVILIIFITTIYQISYSIDSFEKEPFEAKSIRMKGMGGAYRAICDDGYTLYYNPAGLSLFEKEYIQLLNVEFDMSINKPTTIGLFDDASKIGDIDKNEINENDIDFINSYSNTHNHLGTTGPLHIIYIGENSGPDLMYLNWGFGIIHGVDINFDFSEFTADNLPEYNMKSREDLGIYIASSLELPFSSLKKYDISIFTGITLKFLVNWIAYNPNGDFFNLERFSDGRVNLDAFTHVGNGLKIGKALSGDLGLLCKWKNLKIGLNFTDFPGTNYSYTFYDKDFDEISAPPTGSNITVNRDLDAGASYTIPSIGNLDTFWIENIIIGLDVVDIFDNDLRITEKLHSGIEIQTVDFIRFRFGINQLYPTVGLGVYFPYFRVDMAYWSDEIGNPPDYRKKEDNIGISFTFLLE